MTGTKMRKLAGRKHGFPTPLTGRLKRDTRVVFYEVTVIDTVMTNDGEMLRVQLKNNAELANPNCDIAVIVGTVECYKKSGVLDPQAPELWYYNDKFWVKAKSAATGNEYYIDKCYLLYEVEVSNAEELINQTSTGYEIPDPPPPPQA